MNKIYLLRKNSFITFVLISVLVCSAPGQAQENIGKNISLDECVRKGVYDSFAVKKAKLDFYIAETERKYSEAVFDTILYGGAGYSEDKRQQASVFASDDNQLNKYSTGISKMLPTGTEVSTEISSTRSWENSIYVSKNPSHEAELEMSFTQPLVKNFLGMIDRGNVSITKMTIENAGLSEKDEIEGVIYSIEKAYIELIYASEAFQIYEEMLEKAKALYETDKKNYELGISEKVNLLASEANFERVKAEHNIAMNDLETAKANLKLLINMDDTEDIKEVMPADIKEVCGELAGCLKTAFEKRRDYLAAKKESDIKGLDLKLKNNSLWPEVDLNLTMSMNGLERDFEKAAGKSVVADNTYYYAGIEVEVPIENNAARSEQKKAIHKKEKALVELKETERSIITEIGNAFNDVRAIEKSLVFSEKAVKLEEEKLKEEEKRFGSGRSTTKQVIDYQRDLLNAKLEEIGYISKYQKALAWLNRKMNITLTEYEDIL